MLCPKCGAEVRREDTFCDQCGYSLKKRKRTFLPAAVTLALILIAAGGTAVWIVTDDHHTLEEVQAQYQETKDSLAEEDITIVKNAQDAQENSVSEEEETDAQEAEKENTSISGRDEYILPESNSRYLTDSDIEGMSLREINYAKNEIYARHGRKFTSEELQTYFDSKSWYTGKYDPADFDENYSSSTLNNYEKKNAEFLSDKEFSIEPNGYQLDAN